MTATASTWDYVHYDPAEERLRESLCTLGNGYFATRGALPECAADDIHYPGTYAAGCYNRLTSAVAGREVENEDMVNLPNWLPLRFRLPGEEWLTPDTGKVLDHRQTVHLDAGVLERRTRYGLSAGRVLSVRQLRLVHMGAPHLAALRTEFTVSEGDKQRKHPPAPGDNAHVMVLISDAESRDRLPDAAVTAQITENTRVTSGIAGALLAASFVVRAIGDVGDGTVSWWSPQLTIPTPPPARSPAPWRRRPACRGAGGVRGAGATSRSRWGSP